jgi:hypothetical protein
MSLLTYLALFVIALVAAAAITPLVMALLGVLDRLFRPKAPELLSTGRADISIPQPVRFGGNVFARSGIQGVVLAGVVTISTISMSHGVPLESGSQVSGIHG